MNKLKIVFAITIIFLCTQSISAQQKKESKQVDFPKDFATYNEISNGIIGEGNLLHGILPDGPYKTILNEVAYKHYMAHFENYKSGKKSPEFPKNSEILLVQYKDAAAKEPGVILVMNKNPEFNQTGGWGWQGYLMPAKKAFVKDFSADCASCHYKGTKDWDGGFLLQAKTAKK